MIEYREIAVTQDADADITAAVGVDFFRIVGGEYPCHIDLRTVLQHQVPDQRRIFDPVDGRGAGLQCGLENSLNEIVQKPLADKNTIPSEEGKNKRKCPGCVPNVPRGFVMFFFLSVLKELNT